MRVRATQTGYYGMEMRKEGATFEIHPDHFSRKWMEPLDKKEAKHAAEEEMEISQAKASKKREQDRLKI